MQLLEASRVCIIAGTPGIGKTTLAQVLASAYIQLGYEVIEISEDAEEVNRLWDDASPQLFYYDDFLGQTSLQEKLHKNEDSRLIALLRRVSKSPNKRFVLTTREYILAQARARYERLANEDFDAMTCVVALDDYTTQIRAEILYNHIYFSDLSWEQKSYFAQETIYLPIVTHPNFSPRLVATSLGAFNTVDHSPEEVASDLLANLADPRRIWEHIVVEQLDDGDVQVLLCLLSLGGTSQYHELRRSTQAYREALGLGPSPEILRRGLRIMDGTLTRGAEGQNGSALVTFHNPSVRDYLKTYVRDRPDLIRDLALSAVYVEQLFELLDGLGDPAGNPAAEPGTIQALEERAVVLFEDEDARRSPRDELTCVIKMAIMTRNSADPRLSQSLARHLDTFLQNDWLAESPGAIGQFLQELREAKATEVRDLLTRFVDQITTEIENGPDPLSLW
jgi:hypothetical protein